jgi:uncharacterized repeat protein (TIGR03837 family)
MQWTVFCRVVDNFGDIGFAWRLAADLGARGEDVRLAVDDASALAWMAPRGAPCVEVVAWASAADAPADVWVETFGCGLPDGARTGKPPVRIDVEHLSAEAYVERSHGRPSPRFDADGPAQPLWFYYPGFTGATGGVVREPGLLETRQRFGAGRDWLARLGVEPDEGERCVSLYCYGNAALDGALDALAATPTLLLLTPGPAAEQTSALLGPKLRRGRLRAVRLPALEQTEFDRLLWSCDLNFVRGEDSLVRAIWAGQPFVWQLYAQGDGAHAAKLAAFLGRFLQDAPAPLAAGLGALFASWNGLGAPVDAFAALDPVLVPAWTEHCRRFRDRLAGLADLGSALIEFAASKR